MSNFFGSILVLVGGAGLLVGLVSIVHPLRFLHVYNRWMAVGLVVVATVVGNSGIQISPKLRTEAAAREVQAASDRQREALDRAHADRLTREAAETASQKPAYSSSGGCRTDANGNMTCAHQSSIDLGWLGKSNSTSTMKCGSNPVSGAYECNSETSSH